MSKKEEFIREFKNATGKHPESYHISKKYTEFTAIMKRCPNLCKIFYEAWDEAKDESDDSCVGLALLFNPGE